MKILKAILLTVIIVAAGALTASAHMFSGDNWEWIYSDSSISVYLNTDYLGYRPDSDTSDCEIGIRDLNACENKIYTGYIRFETDEFYVEQLTRYTLDGDFISRTRDNDVWVMYKDSWLGKIDKRAVDYRTSGR